MPSGYHDLRKPKKGPHETPQKLQIVMVAEAKEEVEDEVVIVNPM